MGSASHCCCSSPLYPARLPTFSRSLLLSRGDAARIHIFSLRRRSPRHPLRASSKMFVPGFGSLSPEAKAASTLHNYFTFLAVKILLVQLEEYNPEAYKELREFTDRTPLNNGDKFCAILMRESSRHKELAMRILEVRSAYASEEFQWDNLQKLTIKNISESNKALMRQFLLETSSME